MTFQYAFGFAFSGPLIPTNVRSIGVTMWSAHHSFVLALNAIFLWDQYYALSKTHPAQNTLHLHPKTIFLLFVAITGFEMFRIINVVSFGSPLDIVGGTVFLLMQLGAGMAFVFTGYKYLREIRETLLKTSSKRNVTSTNDEKIVKIMDHMTIHLQRCSFFIVCYSIGVIFIATGRVSYPLSFLLGTIWMFFSKLGMILTQTIALKPANAFLTTHSLCTWKPWFVSHTNSEYSPSTSNVSSSNAIQVQKRSPNNSKLANFSLPTT
ncbi:MAG: hypothetical protein ACTSUE_15170 [Promethearchaeota archaeon]